MKKSLLTLACVAAYALACWAVESWRDARPSRAPGSGWLVLIGTGIAALVLLLTLHFAQA